MLDPTILATEILLISFAAACKVTLNSGAEVPKATIVNPITKFGTLSHCAIFTAESTNIEEPLARAKTQAAIMILLINISMFLISI
jgi:hypothetical protein